MTMSASLPGVSVPHLSRSAAHFAPLTVAHCRTCRTVTGAGAFGSMLARRFAASARWTKNVARISPNMSVLYDVSLSTLSPGCMPKSSAFWKPPTQADAPLPSAYCASDRVQTATLQPVSRTIRHTASVRLLAWLKVKSGASRFAFPNSSICSEEMPSAWIFNPRLRANAQLSRFGFANARSVTSWSADMKYFFWIRARSAGHWLSHVPNCGGPDAWTARMPESNSASMAASECAAVRELWELSMMHVMPASMQP